MNRNHTPDQVSRDNRKYRPIFVAILLASAAAGAVIGVLGVILLNSDSLFAGLETLGMAAGAAAPFTVLLAAPFWLGGLYCYRRAKALFARWDGEEEALPERVESWLNWALAWLAASQVIDFLIFGINVSLVPLGYLDGGLILIVSLQMLVILLAGISLQGRVVDLTRRLNPEKQGSVYDIRFRKKWMDSCDEAERQRIGQAAYSSYTVSSYAGLFVWAALVVVNLFVPVGPLPVIAVMIPWAAGQFAYLAECIRAQGSRGKEPPAL